MSTNKTEVIALIKTMASEGKSRDDVMLYMFGAGIKPSAMNGYIKSATVTFGRVGSGWRQASAKYFSELEQNKDGKYEANYDDWKEIMVDGVELSGSEDEQKEQAKAMLLSPNNQAAYTNHFKLWVSIKNGEVM